MRSFKRTIVAIVAGAAFGTAYAATGIDNRLACVSGLVGIASALFYCVLLVENRE